MTDQPHPYINLAFEAVRHYLEQESHLPCPEDLTGDLKEKAGTFVSIKKGKELRGCIGTLTPNQPSLAQEIIHNAVSAATGDPRFSAVSEKELNDLTFSIDVLTPPEKIADPSELDCKRYGVVVKCGERQGVLLPDLEAIDTVERQIEVCLKKGGIGNNEKYELFRFEVKRYK